MNEDDFIQLEEFINKNEKKFIDANEIKLKKRKKNIVDKLLSKLYFTLRK